MGGWELGAEASLLHLFPIRGPAAGYGTDRPTALGLGPAFGVVAGLTAGHAYAEVEGALLLIEHGIPGDEFPLVSVVGGVGPGWWWGGDTGHAGIQGTLSVSLLVIPVFGYVRTGWAVGQPIPFNGGVMLKLPAPLDEVLESLTSRPRSASRPAPRR